MVALMVAPARAGKTGWCIERVRQVRRDQPGRPIWILLPDRYQAAAIQGRLAAPEPAADAHVGTFGDLYDALLGQAGHAIAQMPGAASSFVIRQTIQAQLGRAALGSFAAIAETPGFRQLVAEVVSELKRAHTPPDRFRAACAADPRLHELADLYVEYEHRLSALGWTDQEGVSWRVLDALAAQPDLATTWALVVADGFDSFEGSQLDVLAALAERVPELVITLPGTLTMDRPAHRRFQRTLDRLTGRLDMRLINLPDRAAGIPGVSRLAPVAPSDSQLAHLEQALFQPRGSGTPQSPPDPDGTVTLIEARSPADEAREALRWLKARIVRDGVPPGACAIITPEPERYRPHLREVAAEFGLPLRFSAGGPLAAVPAMAALLDLLALPPRFTRRLTIEALRSPFFDLSAFGLERRHADVLELVSRGAQVIEGLDQWSEALGRLARAEPDPESNDEDAVVAQRPKGPAAEALLQALLAFARRLRPPRAQPLGDWASWVEELLADLSFGAHTADVSPREQAALAQWQSSLTVLGTDLARVLGDQPIDYATFVGELRGLLGSTMVVDPGPGNAATTGRSAILVLKVLEARGPRFQAVAMVGLGEGLFPQVERADPFLDEALRARLGLEPRLGREQRGLFYLAVTRADRWLLLTRPYLAQDGQPREPSPYWSAVLRALPNVTCFRFRPDDQRPLAEAASVEEVLFWAARGQMPPPEDPPALGQRWAYLLHARRVLAARHAPIPASPFEGGVEELGAALGVRFGPEVMWSTSRLEQYGGCPLRFYAETVLDLQPAAEPEPGPNAAQLGALLHAILAQTYRAAPDPTDPEAVLKVLGPIAGQALEDAPRRYGFRPTPVWAHEAAELVRRLEATVRGLAELGAEWTPVGHELAFGGSEQTALSLDVDGEIVRLRGMIDRVDRDEDGRLRVVDYKTGARHLDHPSLVAGERLQLPIYALAARDALALGEPAEGLYWAILAAQPGRLRLSRFEYEDDTGTYEGPDGAITLAGRHIGRILAGVRRGQFAPRPPREGCPSYCACAAWCWRYRPERTW